MRIEKCNDCIKIFDCVDFDIKKILECGQIFRFCIDDLGEYVVNSQDKIAHIKQGNPTLIFTKDVDYFYNFFDLNTNYDELVKKINQPIIKKAIEYGRGIRILKQPLVEVIYSFVISANNNIKRIQKIIERLCQSYGKKIDGFYAFPTLSQLKNISQSQYNNIGAGYRGDYLYKLSQQLSENFLAKLNELDTTSARKELIKLSGVGPKVADCILLFGMNRFDVFPVDTWIEKVYKNMFNEDLKNRDKISKFLVNYFGDLSGLCQQYLFYYKRENA